MKKWRLTAAAFICAAAMVFPAQAGTWMQEGDTWRYQQEDGGLVANCWIQDEDGRWYYLDQKGIMVRNRVTPDGYVTGRDGAYIPGMWQDGDSPVAPWDYQQLLGRGMDVDWSKTQKGKENYNLKVVQDFEDAGIDHVRIRIKDKADNDLFVALDEQIDDCINTGIIPIIAYQADEFKNNPNEENLQKVVDWWRIVAERYKDKSYLLSFDLLIEATDALNKQPEKLNELYERIVTEIRKTNPQRIIFISPRLRSDAQYLSELKIPSQANGYLMAEWHFYAAGPSKDNDRKLWTIGTENEKKLITDKINYALEWQKKTDIPTWVGGVDAG